MEKKKTKSFENLSEILFLELWISVDIKRFFNVDCAQSRQWQKQHSPFCTSFIGLVANEVKEMLENLFSFVFCIIIVLRELPSSGEPHGSQSNHYNIIQNKQMCKCLSQGVRESGNYFVDQWRTRSRDNKRRTMLQLTQLS